MYRPHATAACGPTPHPWGLPIQSHLLSGRRSLSPGPPLPSPYLRGTCLIRNISYQKLHPSYGKSRQNLHTPSRSSSSRAHVLPGHWPPTLPAFHEPPSSKEIQLPPWLWLLPHSCLRFGTWPSVLSLPLYNACRRKHSNRQSSGLPSCRMIREFHHSRTSAMPTWTCRYEFHGHWQYLSLLPYYRWQPLY